MAITLNYWCLGVFLIALSSFLRRKGRENSADPFSMASNVRTHGNGSKLCLSGEVWTSHEEIFLYQKDTQTLEQGSCSGGQCPELVSVEEAFGQHPY